MAAEHIVFHVLSLSLQRRYLIAWRRKPHHLHYNENLPCIARVTSAWEQFLCGLNCKYKGQKSLSILESVSKLLFGLYLFQILLLSLYRTGCHTGHNIFLQEQKQDEHRQYRKRQRRKHILPISCITTKEAEYREWHGHLALFA